MAGKNGKNRSLVRFVKEEYVNITWSVVVVALFVILIVYAMEISVLDGVAEVEFPEFVCDNLEIVGGDHKLRVFPSIDESVSLASNPLQGVRIVNVEGSTVRPWTFSEEGVMCLVDSVLCNPFYCQNITLVVPVNYTEWREWNESILR